MDDITEAMQYIIDNSKCGIHLTINEHKNYYQSTSECIAEFRTKVDFDILQEMIKRDIIIDIQVYQFTPVGSIQLYHYDLPTAIKTIADTLKSDKEES